MSFWSDIDEAIVYGDWEENRNTFLWLIRFEWLYERPLVYRRKIAWQDCPDISEKYGHPIENFVYEYRTEI